MDHRFIDPLLTWTLGPDVDGRASLTLLSVMVLAMKDKLDTSVGQGLEPVCGGHRMAALQELRKQKGDAAIQALLAVLNIQVLTTYNASYYLPHTTQC